MYLNVWKNSNIFKKFLNFDSIPNFIIAILLLAMQNKVGIYLTFLVFDKYF